MHFTTLILLLSASMPSILASPAPINIIRPGDRPPRNWAAGLYWRANLYSTPACDGNPTGIVGSYRPSVGLPVAAGSLTLLAPIDDTIRFRGFTGFNATNDGTCDMDTPFDGKDGTLEKGTCYSLDGTELTDVAKDEGVVSAGGLRCVFAEDVGQGAMPRVESEVP